MDILQLYFEYVVVPFFPLIVAYIAHVVITCMHVHMVAYRVQYAILCFLLSHLLFPIAIAIVGS